MITIRKYFIFFFVVFTFGICMFVYYLPTSPGQYFTNLNMHATKLLGYVANIQYHGVKEVASGSSLQIVTQPCPGVLSGMMTGTWRTRELTSQERAEVYNFYRESRDVIPNSTNYQRPDLKCGNLPYAETDPKVWFRVLCNPDGSTPCCFHNRCENKTIDECRGPMNFDLRPRVHAEYSTWLPQNRRCSVKIFDSQSACKLLEGSTIYVIGDSLMRQLYTALLMVIRGDTKTGALKPNTPKGKCFVEGGRIYSIYTGDEKK